MKKAILFLLGILLCLTLLPLDARAADYAFFLDDGAGLLTEEEGETLRIRVSSGIANVGNNEVTVLVSDGKME